MPEHTDFAVFASESLLGAFHRLFYSEILVITGEDAGFLGFTTHRQREVSDYVNESPAVKDTLKESLKVGYGGAFIRAVGSLPFHIAVERCGDGAYLCVCHIADHKHLSGSEKLWHLSHIILQLQIAFLGVGNFLPDH